MKTILSCKTCKHLITTEDNREGCEVSSTYLPLPAKSLIEYVGCASHSDATEPLQNPVSTGKPGDDHDQVLSELVEFVQDWYSDKTDRSDSYLDKGILLLKKIVDSLDENRRTKREL